MNRRLWIVSTLETLRNLVQLLALVLTILWHSLWADSEVAIVVNAFFSLFVVIGTKLVPWRRRVNLNFRLVAAFSNWPHNHRVLLLFVFRLLETVLWHGCLRLGRLALAARSCFLFAHFVAQALAGLELFELAHFRIVLAAFACALVEPDVQSDGLGAFLLDKEILTIFFKSVRLSVGNPGIGHSEALLTPLLALGLAGHNKVLKLFVIFWRRLTLISLFEGVVEGVVAT